MDDITLWCCSGSAGEQEDTIQQGLNIICAYTQKLGLSCSPEKTEYIAVVTGQLRYTEPARQQICLHLNGKPVPRPRYLRVLGFWLQDDGKWKVWLSRLHTQLNYILYHILQRIARSNQGFREDQLRRVTLVYSRVMYQYPYTNLGKTPHVKLDCFLRKFTRLTLGVPNAAPNDTLEMTLLFNTLQDRKDIHLQGQVDRLRSSEPNRVLLRSLGHNISSLPPIPTS